MLQQQHAVLQQTTNNRHGHVCSHLLHTKFAQLWCAALVPTNPKSNDTITADLENVFRCSGQAAYDATAIASCTCHVTSARHSMPAEVQQRQQAPLPKRKQTPASWAHSHQAAAADTATHTATALHACQNMSMCQVTYHHCPQHTQHGPACSHRESKAAPKQGSTAAQHTTHAPTKTAHRAPYMPQ